MESSLRLTYGGGTNSIYSGINCSMDGLVWIALITSHISDSNEQTVRYYGRISNAARKKAKAGPLSSIQLLTNTVLGIRGPDKKLGTSSAIGAGRLGRLKKLNT